MIKRTEKFTKYSSADIMASLGINLMFVFSMTIALLCSVECQTEIPQIIALLGNVNDTSTNMCSILPHLESVLRNQENLQIVTNLLLENNTAAAEEMVQILRHQAAVGQNDVITLFQSQQANDRDMKSLLIGHQDILSQMASNQNDVLTLLQNHLDYHNETMTLLQNQQETLTQMAATETQMAQTQTQVAVGLNDIVTLLQNLEENHNETVNLLQNQQHILHQMANSFSQVLTLMEMQSQQLQNVTNTMNTAVTALEKLQETLNISHSIPAALDLQENQTELLSQISPICKRNCSEIGFEEIQTTLTSESMTVSTTTSIGQVTQDTTSLTSLRPTIQDCSDLISNGNYTSNVYTITPRNGLSFDVYCDMNTDFGGWVVIQKRVNGFVTFYRKWDDYVQGFGSLNGELWLGLSKIHQLTQSGHWVLRVDIEDFEGNAAYAIYNLFKLGDAASNYTLSIAAYQGTAGDSITGYHSLNNMQFSTYDRDNDLDSRKNCAVLDKGAWWYRSCTNSNLNGLYLGPSSNSYTGVGWYHWKNSWQSLKKSEMKIRRAL